MSWRDRKQSTNDSQRDRRFRFRSRNSNSGSNHSSNHTHRNQFQDVFQNLLRRRVELSTAQLSNALDKLNAMTFPRRDVTHADCENMILMLIRTVPEDSEMLGSKLCSFVNTLCVKHIVLSHRGIDSVLKYLLKFGSRASTSVFATDALKALSSLLIENGDRCSEHVETIASRLQRFADTSSVNLNAKHAAILALANLCAKSGAALRECGKSKALMDIFIRNFVVHAKVRPESSSSDDDDENDELIAKLIASILYGLEMVLSADPKLQQHFQNPSDIFNTLTLLVGYRCHRNEASYSRVRVHAVSLLRCLIRGKKSPFRQIVVQRLGTLVPSDEHEALSSKPVRTSVLTLITHDSYSTVRSEAALLAASLVQIIPRQLLEAYKIKKRNVKGSSSLSLSDRISKSLYCTHSVLLGSLKRERVKSTLSAVLKAVEILVQVTPWNVWNPKNLVRVMKSLRTHIGSARQKRGHDGKGEESSDQESYSESDTTVDPRQRRERQQHTYTAAMKVMKMAISATTSSQVETYICSNTSRYGPLVNEILSTHTSIDLERLALGSSLAKSFPNALIRHWKELNSFLRNAFCSSNHKIRAEALRIAGSLFRGEVDITSKKEWENVVMQIGDAVQDPSSLVRAAAATCLSNLHLDAWKLLPKTFVDMLCTKMIRLADKDTTTNVRSSACRWIGVTMLIPSSNEHRLETLLAAASESQLNVRVAAVGALANYSSTPQPRRRDLELMSRIFFKSIDDHDRVSANAVRGLGCVICHLSKFDDSPRLLLSDLVLKLKNEIESNKRGASATAQKCLWNACAALSRVAEECSSDVLHSYVTYWRLITRRLVKICAENENYKVRSAAVDAISCFIRRGENLLDTSETRLMFSTFLDIYLKEELKSGILASRMLSSLRILLRDLILLKDVVVKHVGDEIEGSGSRRKRLIRELISEGEVKISS